MKIGIVGAGWAGLACAVAATRNGHAVTLLEAARVPGGRARALPGRMANGMPVVLDNGQHILIGAYAATLRLMREIGLAPATLLHRLPLALRFPDGGGLQVPAWPPPLDLLAGIAAARGWTWRDKLSLGVAVARWRRAGFRCDERMSVAALCQGISARVLHELIEPLCLSALNTPPSIASGQVFLRVLHDALFAGRGGADLLLPRVDLGALFPEAALAWLRPRGAVYRDATRATALVPSGAGWRLDAEDFDAVVLACPAGEAARLAAGAGAPAAAWCQAARALPHEGIATVYLQGRAGLGAPLRALRSSPEAPAQFVFDRGALGGPKGLLAFVISATQGESATLEAQVLAQARSQLGLEDLQPVRTIVERRATFLCRVGLQRPGMQVAARLLACGDYVAGPYPATLEGAVRNGLAAAAALDAPAA